MASLKDIMDVDVEPLESQAYRRSREALSQQASHVPIAPVSHTPSPPLDEPSNKGKTPIKRRRSNRVSKPADLSDPARQTIARRRSSVAGEAMNFNSDYQAGSSNQASISDSPQRSPRGLDSTSDIPVKYTPVTGRISRAKKGVPVHTCDICRPVKTFTRAEHLRRHQLSHQKPAYPCTFENCERAFHRPDLLARHQNRHETQGEKAYRSGDPRSRASSSASESRTPSLQVDTPSQPSINSVVQTSPTDPMTPRTSGSGDSSMTASSYKTITSSFQAVNFSSPSSGSQKRSASEAHLTESATSPGPGMSTRNSSDFDHMDEQTGFSHPPQSSFDDSYDEGGSAQFSNYTTTPQLPLLRIPDDSWAPGLSYNNSPWCSSASSSTYSTQSDGSRAPIWTHRARSASVATLPDWPAPSTANHWPVMSSTPQDLRSPAFESIIEQYETPYTSPRMTPPLSAQRQLLDVPASFGGFYMESVGTPTLSTYNKPLAQNLPAPSRSSNARLETRGKAEFIQSHRLGHAFSLSTTPTYQPHLALEMYLSSYWQCFHPDVPIIHQGTFDAAENNLLTSAMAAIGTQYHDTFEARMKGSELNEQCKKDIDLRLNWDLHTMQAILLTELFTRFRGRKTIVRLSRPFEALYSRLLKDTDESPRTVSNQSPGTPASADALLERFGASISAPNIRQPNANMDWCQWLEAESRQRLLSACFMFDIHQSLYHQQPRSKASLDDKNDIKSLICLPCPESLWNASSSTEWQSQRAGYASQPLRLVGGELSTQAFTNTNPFTQSLMVCWFAAQLPTREDPTYPNDFLPQSIIPNLETFMNLFPTSLHARSYLALYHTPLHDLLAIAGDTWVFAQKVTPPSAFHAAQSRLKTWATSLAAAQATSHACEVLLQALSQSLARTSGRAITTSLCLSDYWSFYVSTLICWAFGHKYQTANNGALSRSASTADSGAISTDDTSIFEETRLKALAYTNGMLSLTAEELLTSKANIKGDTASLIDTVRYRLEVESAGHHCGLLVDAVAVLGKIKEGGRGKWF